MTNEANVVGDVFNGFEGGIVKAFGDHFGDARDALVGVNLCDDKVAKVGINQPRVYGCNFHGLS